MDVVTAVYGHRHLGLVFRPVIEIQEHSFLLKGRQYPWSAVQSVKVYDGLYLALLQYPLALIRLKDGKKIWLSARALEKEGSKRQVGLFTSKGEAFRELVAIFKQHVASLQRIENG
jgi:hypothetical protein